MAGVRILFVCLGNICRSPTAEGVMRKLVREARLAERIDVESAGTGSWHVGDPPDARALRAAQARGIALEGTARQVTPSDFDDFDLIVAMDRANLHALEALARGRDGRARLHLLRDFERAGAGASVATGATGGPGLDVPDPYHGGAHGFERVLDIVEACCASLLEAVRDDALRNDARPPDARPGDGLRRDAPPGAGPDNGRAPERPRAQTRAAGRS